MYYTGIGSRETPEEVLKSFIRIAKYLAKEGYLLKWVAIANYFKGRSEIMFQSYTKSVKFLKRLDLKDINIHFVYSIWKDTNKDDIALARQLELPTFTALSRKEVEEARERGIYVCPKSSDGLCKECYKCNHKEIVVSYH